MTFFFSLLQYSLSHNLSLKTNNNTILITIKVYNKHLNLVQACTETKALWWYFSNCALRYPLSYSKGNAGRSWGFYIAIKSNTKIIIIKNKINFIGLGLLIIILNIKKWLT